jgi:hypothetical protein
MDDDGEGETPAIASTGDVKFGTVLLSVALLAAIALVVFAIAVMIGLVT